MGGSSKPEDPKVTPFVEPPGPRNPVPNYFGGTGAGSAYKPDFGASATAFGSPPAPTAPTAPAPQPAPMQAPQQAPQQTFQPMQSVPSQAPQAPQPAPQGQFMPFTIPTRQGGQGWPGQFGMGGGYGAFLPENIRTLLQQFMGGQGAPRRPEYTNYTDVTPGTQSQGAPDILGWPGAFNRRGQ